MMIIIFTAKGRTNIELREQFILAQGVSQSMTGFTAKSPSGSSYSGSSTHSAGTWSTRSPSSATGPITKVSLYVCIRIGLFIVTVNMLLELLSRWVKIQYFGENFNLANFYILVEIS